MLASGTAYVFVVNRLGQLRGTFLGLSKLTSKAGGRSDTLEKQIAGVPLACETHPERVSEITSIEGGNKW